MNKKKIFFAVFVIFCFGFLNYLLYLGKISNAKSQLKKENEKVVAILNSQNYNINSLPYAIVDIENLDDIKVNQDFFAEAKKDDRVYYFESLEKGERLAALYRPETESVISVKKE